MGDAQRGPRNCAGARPDDFVTRFDWAPELRQCPNSYFADDPELWWYVGLFQDWKTVGSLPWASLYDAPGPIFHALKVLATEEQLMKNEGERKQREETEKQQKKLRQQAKVNKWQTRR